ncbi:p8 [Olive mild mosaic virus]|uniref:p8 n=1 Tax=Olive mild mosaic virus TaxID=295090 RepID=Q58ZJ4_9TOMB|nr:p8 [Olive mild mosaic virus]AAU93818.1 p8 [Olive mild mosaic virus]AEC50093.1 p8 [Olive mild mosaic virus]
MDYQTDINEDNVSISGRARRGTGDKKHNGSGMSGVKRHAVSETAQKSQQGTGNGTMTNIAEEQTITVTYNFNF